MRRIGTAAAAAILVWGSAASVSSQTKPLVIAVEDDAAPWSRADGTGYANDVVIAAFKSVGIAIDLKVVPYARCKRMAVIGDAAGCLSMSPSPDFAGVIDLSAKPLFTCFAGYFANVNKPIHVSRQEDLPAKTVVGTVIGYEYPAAVDALRRRGIVVLEESPSEEINLKKLALGRVDLALLTYDDMKSPEWLMARAGVTGTVRPVFRAGVLDSYIGFSRAHPDGPWALRQFNIGHQRIMANGTLERIHATWRQALAREQAGHRR